MKRPVKMSSIMEMRTIVKNVKSATEYVGYDEKNSKPIYNRSAKLPVINATLSEKIHGMNVGFAMNNVDGIWFQSRTNIITPIDDLAGCSVMMESKKDVFEQMIISLAIENNIDLNTKGIVLYMELAGGGIQSKSCFTGTDKLFAIFQRAKVFNIIPTLNKDGGEENNYWIETKVQGKWLESPVDRIFNVMSLNSMDIEIDFERSDLAQNKLVELIDSVELNSPAGQKLGLENTISEGYVCTFEYKNTIYVFKVKGKKHSKTRVKTLKPVDSALVQKQIDFVNEHACKAFRLEQAWQECFGVSNEKMKPTIKVMGDFLRLVIKDVWKEELDIALELELEVKPLNNLISKSARRWFLDELSEEPCG